MPARNLACLASLLPLSVSIAACTDVDLASKFEPEPEPEPECTYGEGLFGGCLGPGFSNPHIGGIDFGDDYPCGWYYCPVAAGGTDLLDVQNNDGIDVSTRVDAPFELEYRDHEDWQTLYTLHAPVAQSALITVSGANIEDQVREIEARDVYDVALVPNDSLYALADPSRFAVHVESAEVVVAIYADEVTRLGYERLVDASLEGVSNAPPIEQTAWDSFTISSAGNYELGLRSGSLGELSFDLRVVDSIDRIEIEKLDDGNPLDGESEFCFHAYAGDDEVPVDFQVSAENVLLDYVSTRNCRITLLDAEADSPAVLTASALGISAVYEP